MVKIIPHVATANVLCQTKFKFPTKARLRPTTHTVHLCIAFSAYNMQEAKYKLLCLSVQQTQIFDVTSQTCCSHYKADLTIPCAYKSHHFTIGGRIHCMLQMLDSCYKYIFSSAISSSGVICQVAVTGFVHFRAT